MRDAQSVLTPIILILVIAVTVVYRLRGGNRFVRLGVAALFLLQIVRSMVSAGPVGTLKFLSCFLAIFAVANFVVLRGWRGALRRRYEPILPGVWPPELDDKLMAWTRELESLHFVLCGDVQSSWRMGSEARKTAWRFFRHVEQPVWVAISANRRPKGIGRAFHSRLADGRFVLTADKQSNEALFPSPSFIISRGRASDSCQSLAALHGRALEATGLTALPVADPATCEVEQHAVWADAMVASGRANVDGDCIALTPGAIFQTMGRTLAAWFS